MRKNAARILGLLVTALALTTSAPHRVSAQQACTLLCIQGYHCCVQGSHDVCVPDSQPC
jgi:hypothetical protein